MYLERGNVWILLMGSGHSHWCHYPLLLRNTERLIRHTPSVYLFHLLFSQTGMVVHLIREWCGDSKHSLANDFRCLICYAIVLILFLLSV